MEHIPEIFVREFDVQILERLEQTETAVKARLKQLEERESELEERESEAARRAALVQADADLREDKLEEREQAVAALEARLGRKEKDLAFYVGQLQGKVESPDDADWWQKQLGASKPAA